MILSFVCLALMFVRAYGSYQDGTEGISYMSINTVDIRANKLVSDKSRIETTYISAPLCPIKANQTFPLDINFILNHELKFNQNKESVILCRMRYSSADIMQIKHLIDFDYRIQYEMDNLPALYDDNRPNSPLVHGFPVGIKQINHPKRRDFQPQQQQQQEKYVLYNHMTIEVDHHTSPENKRARNIVGVTLRAKSFEWLAIKPYDETTMKSTADKFAFAAPKDVMVLPVQFAQEGMPNNGRIEVYYTYDIIWRPSPTLPSARWDRFTQFDYIHHLSIASSVLVLLLLSLVLLMFVLQNIRRLLPSNTPMYEIQHWPRTLQFKSINWKLIHGDVFRAPAISPKWLAALAATGVQMLTGHAFLFLYTLLCQLLHTPADSASTGTLLLMIKTQLNTPSGALGCFLFTTSVCAYFGGYTSAIILKYCQVPSSLYHDVLVAVMFPSLLYLGIVDNLCMEMMYYSTPFNSSSFLVSFAVFLVFCVGCVPCVLLGGRSADKDVVVDVRVNLISRPVPATRWYAHPVVTGLLSGAVTFAALATEMWYLMMNGVLHEPYTSTTYLQISALIALLTCVATSLLSVYTLLAAEDYRWWWRSFLNGAATGLFVLLEFGYFYFTKQLNYSERRSNVVYVFDALLTSLLVSLVFGSVSLLSALWFISTCYSTYKDKSEQEV